MVTGDAPMESHLNSTNFFWTDREGLALYVSDHLNNSDVALSLTITMRPGKLGAFYATTTISELLDDTRNLIDSEQQQITSNMDTPDGSSQ